MIATVDVNNLMRQMGSGGHIALSPDLISAMRKEMKDDVKEICEKMTPEIKERLDLKTKLEMTERERDVEKGKARASEGRFILANEAACKNYLHLDRIHSLISGDLAISCGGKAEAYPDNKVCMNNLCVSPFPNTCSHTHTQVQEEIIEPIKRLQEVKHTTSTAQEMELESARKRIRDLEEELKSVKKQKIETDQVNDRQTREISNLSTALEQSQQQHEDKIRALVNGISSVRAINELVNMSAILAENVRAWSESVGFYRNSIFSDVMTGMNQAFDPASDVLKALQKEMEMQLTPTV
jgi:hypothetical protein